MTGRFYGNPIKKKIILKNWIQSKEEYKKKIKRVNIIRLISLIMVIVCAIGQTVLLWDEETIVTDLFGGLAAGLVVAAIPFFISQSIKVKAIKEYGFPFVKMEQECLILYDDGLEFLYHNNSNQYSESMDVYRIAKENINAVRYDSIYSVITIIGEGELIAYDDYVSKRVNHQNSQRKFYGNSPYTFMISFDNDKKIVEAITALVKNKEE